MLSCLGYTKDMDELDEQTLTALHDGLVSLEKELVTWLDATEDEVKPVDLEKPIGRLTRIDAIQQQKMAKAHRRRATARLSNVRSALVAFNRGDYGCCKRCEEPISLERLNARPEAPLCLDCQSDLEGS